MVLQAQSVSKRTDSGRGNRGQAFNGKHQLMLLRLKTIGPCSLLAELKKMAELKAQLSELAIFIYQKMVFYRG